MPWTQPLTPDPGTDDTERCVAGIDTHKDTHHVAVLDAVGRLLSDREFATTVEGYRQIVAFLRANGPIATVGVEGTGSYGAGITRVLTAAGFAVVEVVRPNRQARRAHGKSDPLDAQQAARAVLAGTDGSTPKSGTGDVEVMRMLLLERRSAMKARTQTINQIHSLLITAPDTIRAAYRGLSSAGIVAKAARARVATPASAAGDTSEGARVVLKRLAQRYLRLSQEISEVDVDLDHMVRVVNPSLLHMVGVGPLVAATLLVAAGDNPERLRSRASFAALVGVAPIPASSGQRIRHRLSRGGNRRANSMIHRIVLLRLRVREPRTMAYVDRRRAEGLTDRDIMRCLKRHVANEVYKHLTRSEPADTSGAQIRAQREAAGLTIRDLARALDIPYQQLRRLEIDDRHDPELATRALRHLAGPGLPEAA